MADQGQRIASGAGRPYQHGFQPAGTGGRHRNPQFLAMKFICGGGRCREQDNECHQRDAHHFPSKLRCSQGWNFARISSVSAVGLRVTSSSSTDTDRAEATQVPSENTT